MESIRCKTCDIKRYPELEGNVKTDVVVIGAGMAGILTAWQLEQAGVHTVVLEADTIGRDRRRIPQQRLLRSMGCSVILL